MKPNPVEPLWAGESCIVAATGPSLSPEVIKRVRFARWLDGWRLIAVNDAYKVLPHADILYAADYAWWRKQDLSKFTGERWSCHSENQSLVDDKSLVYQKLKLRLVQGRDEKGFSSNPAFIHYGSPASSSGFQAVNLALLLGCAEVVLVGFDGRTVDNKTHFFGDHPEHLNRCGDHGYRHMAKSYPPDDRIINATPGSAITAYRDADLETVIGHRGLYRNRAIPDAAADRVSTA